MMNLMFKSFSVTYYYSKLFGWMPIRIPKNDNGQPQRKKNIWCLAGITCSLSYILLLVVSGNITQTINSAIKFQGNQTSSNLTIHDRIQIIVGPMFVMSLWVNQTFIIFIFVLMPFQLKGLIKVFELFSDFFKRHGSIVGDEAVMKKIARNTNIESVLLIVMNTVISITSAVISFKRIRLSFMWKLILLVDNVIKKLEALSLCIQFWCMCSVLTKCFKSLNAALDRLRIRKNQATVFAPDLFILSDRLTLPTNMATFVRQLNRAHTDLCTILDHVNTVYQVLILLTVINCMLSMLPHLFVLGITMAYSNFRIKPPISMVIWPLHYMMRVYIVCKAASLASNEIKRFVERIDNKKIRFSLYGLSYLDDEYFLSVKLYAFNGLCAVATCALMYGNLRRAVSESLTSEVAFQIVPYVHVIITLVCNTIRKYDVTTCFCDHRTADVKPSHCVYWTLTFMSMIVGQWLRLSNQIRSRPTSLPENALKISLRFIPLLSEIHYCRVCTEFKNDYGNLNRLVAVDGHPTPLTKLLAIRADRKRLDDHVRKTTGEFGAQILSEIATTAVTTVFKIHRALRSTERFGNAVTPESAADLLDVLHRILTLFAVCKVSGDVAKEANEIVTNLLNTNPSTDKNLENEILFFLWETDNPPTEVRLVYGTFEMGPRLFVSVFSWCVGFILILLQFRWPRTY